MIAWLLLALAHAQDPTGRLAVALSPEATVTVEPRREGAAIEVTIHNNHVPLREQLKGRSATGMLDVSAISVGGGTWFLTIYPIDDGDTVVAEPYAEGMTFRTVDAPPPTAVPPPPEITLDALLDGTADPPIGLPSTRTLVPLAGGAAATSDATRHRIPLVPWRGTPLTDDQQATLAGTTLGWDAVMRYQHALVMSDDVALKQAARYRLAVAYDALALPRESDHYLSELQAGGDDSLAVALLRARSAVRMRDWDAVRGHCAEAAAADPTHTATLQCLTMLAVQTGTPSAGAAGRLLRDSSNDPAARLLAARALLRDHHYSEALDVLRGLVDASDTPSDELLAVWGDAELAAGELEDARAAWEAVRWNGRDGDLGRVRLHLIDMLEQGPATWLHKLPPLHELAVADDRTSAEALQIIAQIGARMGDPEVESMSLSSLLKRHRSVAEQSDVLSRLMASCGTRLHSLHEQERFVEEVTLYRRCWDVRLNDVSRDTTPVQDAADAYRALSLPEAALDVQLEVARMRSRDDRPDNTATVRLATLYNDVARPLEALQTVRYIRANRPEPELRRSLMVEAARAHIALEDPEAALRELITAEADDWEARGMWAGLMVDLVGCSAVQSELGYRADAGQPPLEFGTRCLIELGDVASAGRVRTDSAHPAHRAQTASVAVAQDEPLPESEDAPDWYAALAKEQEAHAAFEARIRGQ